MATLVGHLPKAAFEHHRRHRRPPATSARRPPGAVTVSSRHAVNPRLAGAHLGGQAAAQPIREYAAKGATTGRTCRVDVSWRGRRQSPRTNDEGTPPAPTHAVQGGRAARGETADGAPPRFIPARARARESPRGRWPRAKNLRLRHASDKRPQTWGDAQRAALRKCRIGRSAPCRQRRCQRPHKGGDRPALLPLK